MWISLRLRLQGVWLGVHATTSLKSESVVGARTLAWVLILDSSRNDKQISTLQLTACCALTSSYQPSTTAAKLASPRAMLSPTPSAPDSPPLHSAAHAPAYAASPASQRSGAAPCLARRALWASRADRGSPVGGCSGLATAAMAGRTLAAQAWGLEAAKVAGCRWGVKGWSRRT
jgi:hypothetical protein